VPAAEALKGGAGARADELRRAVAAAKDVATRARLHVQLAELLRGRDLAAALEELRSAAADAPGLPAVTLAVLSVARTLPAKDRLQLLVELAPPADTTVPAWSAAAAEAEAELGEPGRAADAWLALARDERVPLHRRRVAARKAEALAAQVSPDVQRAALRLSAALTSGASRLGYLRRALALAVPVAAADELVALATEWLEAGGPGHAVDAALARAQAAGSPPQALDRAAAEATRRGSRTRTPGSASSTGSTSSTSSTTTGGRRPARATGKAGSAGSAPAQRAKAAAVGSAERLDVALAEAKSGHANRARRLAEEALRGAPPSEALAARAAALETALREGGYLKEALRVRRTFLEGVPEAARGAPLAALAEEAAQAGLASLARIWRADSGLGVGVGAPGLVEEMTPEASTPAGHYLHAQRLLARLRAGDSLEAVLASLERAVSGHAGASAAMELADDLLGRVVEGDELARRRLELLRAAHAAEFEPARRLRLGERLAETLARQGDLVGAVSVLEQALRGAPPGDEGGRLRGERARLLRKIGRGRELAAALEADAAALVGDERLRALAERATLLDAAGEFEAALDVRLMALAEFPADLPLVGAARRRLESTGRPAESLRLAVAAVERVADLPEKLRLLRDIAALSERSGANPNEAAAAWLAVLDLDPEDAAACASAERLLLAVGDWERCADLLSWAAARHVAGAARPPAGEPRPALLWRLAELRRARLGQADEALRLYGELLAESGRAQGPLHDPPELATFARRDAVVGLHTARAAVAPTAADRARALLDRALLLLERARPADAEHDVMRALDLDPRNIACVAALERLYEGSARWVELAHALRQRAAALPPEPASRLWFGAGRASERTGDRVAAREAYRRAMSLDPALPEPIAALGGLAARDGDWNEVATLLESEAALVGPSPRKGRLLAELAAVHGERLGNPQRAIELLDAAAALLPEEPRMLDLASRFNLLAGRWEPAVQALDRLATLGAVPADAAERYHQAGAAAEAQGHVDRALVLYSRSYARNTSYRPTLERLSEICFDKDQFDNAWKATEALLDRHGGALVPRERAVLLLRSAVADLHIAERIQATLRLSAVVTRGGGFSPDVGIRDVAESWSGMRAEPRLLANMDRPRRDRVVARATEALALAVGVTPPALDEAHLAREILGSLAVVEERWDDALGLLEALADAPPTPPAVACGFLLAAGDIRAGKLGDRPGAQVFYDRASALAPKDSRLLTRLPGAVVMTIAHDVTDEMIL
jgi:tetratricopeptide (TPR) repeat protein